MVLLLVILLVHGHLIQIQLSNLRIHSMYKTRKIQLIHLEFMGITIIMILLLVIIRKENLHA